MTTRRVTAQPDETLEVLDPTGQSVLKVRVLQGVQGNQQVFVFSQPCCCTHLDLTQPQVAQILQDDPSYGWGQ